MSGLFLVGILIVAVGVVVWIAKCIAAHRFRCGRCFEEFSISWRKVIVTEHSGREYWLECPFCKTKGWCTEQKAKKREH